MAKVQRFSNEWVPRTQSLVSNKMPTRQGGVGLTSHKFFTMGVRADMYGKSPQKGMQRIGLELRDPTHKMDELREHVSSVSEAVSTYRWGSMPAKPNASIAFQNFEELKYIDYQNGQGTQRD